jgi:hypothetical protein
MTSHRNEPICPCGAVRRVLWSEGGYRDCAERVIEVCGEFDHRRVPGVRIGESFEVRCRRCGRPVELGARIPAADWQAERSVRLVAVALDGQVVLRVYRGGEVEVEAPIPARRAAELKVDLLGAALKLDRAQGGLPSDGVVLEAQGQQRVARVHARMWTRSPQLRARGHDRPGEPARDWPLRSHLCRPAVAARDLLWHRQPSRRAYGENLRRSTTTAGFSLEEFPICAA